MYYTLPDCPGGAEEFEGGKTETGGFGFDVDGFYSEGGGQRGERNERCWGVIWESGVEGFELGGGGGEGCGSFVRYCGGVVVYGATGKDVGVVHDLKGVVGRREGGGRLR